jgi:phosphohistidine phosphatase
MPLIIDLVRHGEALPSAAGGDAARPLSAAGRAAIERLRERLAADGWSPDRILASPLLRARQTAELLVAAARPAPAIEISAALEPDQDPAAVLDVIAPLGTDDGHIVLVTHQPLVGRLAIELTGREAGFSPGTFARVSCAAESFPRGGELVRLLRPEELY